MDDWVFSWLKLQVVSGIFFIEGLLHLSIHYEKYVKSFSSFKISTERNKLSQHWWSLHLTFPFLSTVHWGSLMFSCGRLCCEVVGHWRHVSTYWIRPSYLFYLDEFRAHTYDSRSQVGPALSVPQTNSVHVEFVLSWSHRYSCQNKASLTHYDWQQVMIQPLTFWFHGPLSCLLAHLCSCSPLTLVWSAHHFLIGNTCSPGYLTTQPVTQCLLLNANAPVFVPCSAFNLVPTSWCVSYVFIFFCLWLLWILDFGFRSKDKGVWILDVGFVHRGLMMWQRRLWICGCYTLDIWALFLQDLLSYFIFHTTCYKVN